VGTRLAIVNENIPNMVAQISAKLADASINITSLLNESRENIAYTVIDIPNRIDESVINNIMSIHGVLRLRTFN